MMKKNFIITLMGYILFVGMVVNFYFLDKLAFYSHYLLYALLLLVMKDIFTYMYGLKILSTTSLNQELLEQNGVSMPIRFLIFNRRYIFPFLLIFYILILLITQTKIFGLNLTSINQNVWLIGVVVSGIGTIFKDDFEKDYEIKTPNLFYTLFTLTCVFLFSFLGTYIILHETAKLGTLSYVISFISGILIFLVGILILEEDEEILPEESNHQNNILS